MLQRRIVAFALALMSLALSACAEDGPSDTTADASLASADANVIAAADATTNAPDTATAQLATLRGNVMRSVAPMSGGVGNLFIALFEQDPVTAQNPPPPVGQVMVENADMSGDGAAIPYEIVGVEPRTEPYFIVAFLDDNMTASMNPADAGPDMGDLVSLNGLASPSVVIDAAGTVDMDITLNLAMPF